MDHRCIHRQLPVQVLGNLRKQQFSGISSSIPMPPKLHSHREMSCLPIPLYDPDIPLFYEILAHSGFSRAIFQLSGDCIRLMLEFANCGAGKGSLYSKELRDPKFADLEIIAEKYTVASFFENYELISMKKENTRWGIRLKRKDNIDEAKILMQDIDWHSGKNTTPRQSKDDKWCVFPLMLKGPYIAGSNVLPENLATYQPWVFSWPEKEKEIQKLKHSYHRTGKASTLLALRSYTDEIIAEIEELANIAKTGDKGKGALRREKPTAPPSKKRKVRSSSPSNIPSHENSENDEDNDDLAANEDSPSESSMTKLSGLFSDSLQGMGDSQFANTCKDLATLCDVPLLDGDNSLRGVSRSVTPDFLHSLNSLAVKASFAVASYLERRRENLEKKNLQFRTKNEELEAEVKCLHEKNRQLEIGSSSYKNKISSLQQDNNQLYDSESRYREKIEELEAEKEELAKNLSSRNNKYSRLKNQIKITVANFKNDVMHFRNQTIQMVCDDHSIPHSDYPCLLEEIPQNTPSLIISDSEADDEECDGDEGYDGDEGSDADEEGNKSDEGSTKK